MWCRDVALLHCIHVWMNLKWFVWAKLAPCPLLIDVAAIGTVSVTCIMVHCVLGAVRGLPVCCWNKIKLGWVPLTRSQEALHFYKWMQGFLWLARGGEAGRQTELQFPFNIAGRWHYNFHFSQSEEALSSWPKLFKVSVNLEFGFNTGRGAYNDFTLSVVNVEHRAAWQNRHKPAH